MKPTIKPARFITLEGIDGTGKTSSVPTIRACLTAHGITCITTREPGGTAFGEALRHLLLQHGHAAICPEADALAMFTARAQHLHEVIRPNLASGTWVVCDRFTDATYSYQGGGRGLAATRIARMETWVHSDLQPDLSLLFDAPSAVAEARAKVPQADFELPQFDRFHNGTHDFQERVRNCYLQRAAAEPRRFYVIDATTDLATVQTRVRDIMEAFLAEHASTTLAAEVTGTDGC